MVTRVGWIRLSSLFIITSQLAFLFLFTRASSSGTQDFAHYLPLHPSHACFKPGASFSLWGSTRMVQSRFSFSPQKDSPSLRERKKTLKISQYTPGSPACIVVSGARPRPKLLPDSGAVPFPATRRSLSSKEISQHCVTRSTRNSYLQFGKLLPLRKESGAFGSEKDKEPKARETTLLEKTFAQSGRGILQDSEQVKSGSGRLTPSSPVCQTPSQPYVSAFISKPPTPTASFLWWKKKEEDLPRLLAFVGEGCEYCKVRPFSPFFTEMFSLAHAAQGN